MEDTGVEAMSSNRRRGVKEAGEKCDGAGELRSVEYMFMLTCQHVLHHTGSGSIKAYKLP